MKQFPILFVLVVLVCLPTMALAQSEDCTYQPWAGSVQPFESRNFANVSATGTNYDMSLWNNFAYYRGLPTPDPPTSANLQFLRRTDTLGNESKQMVAQYYQKLHPTRTAEAVILIHGSSLYPDAWFSDSALSSQWGANYTRYGGSTLFDDGFDVFAPYVTHSGKFEAMTRRVAAAYGDEFLSLDVRRVLTLFDDLKSRGYLKVHIVGVSYGGWLAVLAARTLAADPIKGAVLAIEGWLPSRRYLDLVDKQQTHLQSMNWEMTFSPAFSVADFVALPSGVTLAFGSCNAYIYQTPYADLPASQVVTYVGAHEFNYEAWLAAYLSIAPTPPTVTAPASVTSGETLPVTVTNGPGHTHDWIGLYSTTKADNEGYVLWRFLNESQTAPGSGLSSAIVQIPAPTVPGTYDVRLFGSGTYSRLALSRPITVR
jgi:pimeloyl-ACP methyl ester carboxylesterase